MSRPSDLLNELTFAVSLRPLEPDEIALAFAELFDATVADPPKENFLTEWAQRGELPDELAAAVETLLPQALDPGVRGHWQGRPLLDCCGTGGGGLNLFNVSTTLLFVLPELGIPVVKHGNRGLTKRSGSADVLEALGLRLETSPGEVVAGLEEVGAAFLFAPHVHPAFAAIAPIRRKLGARGQRTIFNLLGPLLNPARPAARFIGVFLEEHLNLYARALSTLGCPAYTIALGRDQGSGLPLGEASAHGPTQTRGTLERSGQKGATLYGRRSRTAHPQLDSLRISNAAESAAMILAIFKGSEQGFARETLVVNAAWAAWTQGGAASLAEGEARVAEALDSGGALKRLRRWQALSSKLA